MSSTVSEAASHTETHHEQTNGENASAAISKAAAIRQVMREKPQIKFPEARDLIRSRWGLEIVGSHFHGEKKKQETRASQSEDQAPTRRRGRKTGKRRRAGAARSGAAGGATAHSRAPYAPTVDDLCRLQNVLREWKVDAAHLIGQVQAIAGLVEQVGGIDNLLACLKGLHAIQAPPVTTPEPDQAQSIAQ